MTLLPPNLSQSWAETSELLGQISTSELDPQPWYFTNNSLSSPSHDNSLGYTLYPPQTHHFTRAVYLPLAKESSSVGRAQAPHRLASRWSHP